MPVSMPHPSRKPRRPALILRRGGGISSGAAAFAALAVIGIGAEVVIRVLRAEITARRALVCGASGRRRGVAPGQCNKDGEYGTDKQGQTDIHRSLLR
jgi:hypothetical protein